MLEPRVSNTGAKTSAMQKPKKPALLEPEANETSQRLRVDERLRQRHAEFDLILLALGLSVMADSTVRCESTESPLREQRPKQYAI